MAHNVETFNFPEVMLAEFLELLELEMEKDVAEIQAGNEDRIPYPMLAIGKAGIGKTEGIRGVARKHGWGFKEIRLCNYSETDLVGLPMIDKQVVVNADGTKSEVVRTKHAANDLFPDAARDKEFGILLVDEFTSALTNVQVPILQLTDSSRSVGSYSLPRGWKIVIAGNGPDDGGTFEFLPGTVISRASCFYVQADADGWLSWAKKSGTIHPTIFSYINMHRGDSTNRVLHGYEPSASGLDQAFPCPRSWTHLSAILRDHDDRYKALGGKSQWYTDRAYLNENMAMFTNIVASVIGVKATTDFLSFISVADQMQDPVQVINAATVEEREKLKKVADWDNARFTANVGGASTQIDAVGVAYLSFQVLAEHLRGELNQIIRNSNGMPIMANNVPPEFAKHMARAICWVLGITDPVKAKTSYDTKRAHKEFVISGLSTIYSVAASAPGVLDSPVFQQECPVEMNVLADLTEALSL